MRLAPPLLALLALAGCAKPTPPGCDTGAWRAGPAASVLYLACEGRPLAAAWTDVSFDAPDFGTYQSASRGPGRAENTVVVESRGGRKVELRAATADGVTWAVSLNGREYPLADGAVFLVRTGGGEVRVTQVRRDVGGLPAAAETWDRLADEVPEVRAFLAEAGRE